MKFIDHASRIWLPDACNLTIYRKKDKNVTICWHDVIVMFLTLQCFSCQISFWYKLHVSVITGSEATTVFIYTRLTRNPEIRNTSVWVFPNIWRLGWVRNTKFSTYVSHKTLLNAGKFQGYIFYNGWQR